MRDNYDFSEARDNPYTRRLEEPMSGRHRPIEQSALNLEQRRSFPSKVWASFLLLFMGALIWSASALSEASDLYRDLWFRVVVHTLLETIVLFVAAAVVFVWYRPEWYCRLYLKAEKKVGAIYYGVVLMLVVGFLFLLAANALHQWILRS